MRGILRTTRRSETAAKRPEPERPSSPPAARPPAAAPAKPPAKPKEVGGREGPEPTRYGDWEVKGICVDF